MSERTKRIDETNVKKESEFRFDELPRLKSLEEAEMLYYNKANEFLFEARMHPWDFDEDLVLALKMAGYIRNDNIYVTLALYRLLDGVLSEPRPQDAITGKYVFNNKNYEEYVPMPDEVVNRIQDFIWNFQGTKSVGRLTDNERLILFEYYGIDHNPIESVSYDEFGRKNCSGQDSYEDSARRCHTSALNKLRKYGNLFTELYVMNSGNKPYVERLREKLAELMDPEPEILAREKLREYARACKELDINTNYDFVDIRYVFLDPNVNRKLIAANICNLQQLIDAFEDGSIKAKFGETSRDYDSFRRVGRNFLFRYSINVPDSMR